MDILSMFVEWLKGLSPSDWIAMLSMVVSGFCAVATYRMRNSTLQQVKGANNQVFNNCTVTHGGQEECYPDHALAELSSRVLADRTRNYLKLTEKTELVLPDVKSGDAMDLVLRIDAGDQLFPIGINFRRYCLEFPDGRDDLLRLLPNCHKYVYLFAFGGVEEDDGSVKRNWVLSARTSIDETTPPVAHKAIRYAKLINEKLVWSKNWIEIGDVIWWNPTSEMLRAQGYKPVDESYPPSSDPGFHYECGKWEDRGEVITRSWNLVRDQVDPQLEYSTIKTLIEEANERFKNLPDNYSGMTA